MVKKRSWALFLLIAVLVWPVNASALSIPLDTEFSQGLTGVFGEVVLTDVGNNVRFDVSIFNPDPLGGTTADLLGFYFNIHPNVTPTSDISFVFTTPGLFTPAASIDYTGSNTAHKADGDGFYDIVLDYQGHGASDAGNASPSCAGQGCLQSVVFEVAVSGVDLAIENFGDHPPDPNTQSVGGAKGAYTVAVRLNRIGADAEQSAWVGGNAAPEPTTILLLGSGFLGLLGAGAIRRRRAM